MTRGGGGRTSTQDNGVEVESYWNLPLSLYLTKKQTDYLQWRAWRPLACSSGSWSWSTARWAPRGRRAGWGQLPPAAGPAWRSASLRQNTHTGSRGKRGMRQRWGQGVGSVGGNRNNNESGRVAAVQVMDLWDLNNDCQLSDASSAAFSAFRSDLLNNNKNLRGSDCAVCFFLKPNAGEKGSVVLRISSKFFSSWDLFFFFFCRLN